MTLSFSTKWPKKMGAIAGEQNHFIEKIWKGLLICDSVQATQNDLFYYGLEYYKRFGKVIDPRKIATIQPKVHTLRFDPKGRWKVGNKIHAVVNNRTKWRFQFTPVLACTAIQQVTIDKTYTGLIGFHVDGKELQMVPKMRLASLDGFTGLNSFYKWFGTDVPPEAGLKIIHWTERFIY